MSSSLPTTTLGDVQVIFWAIGLAISAITIGGSLAWWMSRQHSQTRKDLYTKINYLERDVNKRIGDGKELCTSNKERVGLLEQAHVHIDNKIETMGDKLDLLQKDVSGTKESVNKLQQKQSEQHVSIVGEIRNMGQQITIAHLKQQQEK